MSTNIFRILIFLLIATSCEKDFASFDSEVINSENAINFSTNSIEYNLQSISEKVNPVQTNNLSSFLLGSYNHPQYGNSIIEINQKKINLVLILDGIEKPREPKIFI